MHALSKNKQNTNQMSDTIEKSCNKSLRIALCPPEFIPFQQAMTGQPATATYLLQRHIATGLINRGHELTFIAQTTIGENVCTTDIQSPTLAMRTWTASRWFGILKRVSWRIQQLLHVPYLNVFSNYSLFYTTDSLNSLPTTIDFVFTLYPGQIDHPKFGVGPGMFGGAVAKKSSSPYYEEYNFSTDALRHYSDLDQFWPQILAETGIIGTLNYALIGFSLIFTKKRESFSLKAHLLDGSIGFFNNFQSPFLTAHLLWVSHHQKT